jgi:chromosomal replication initiator protein
VVCTTAAEFAQDLARDLASQCLPKFHARYCTAALLIVEDIASLAGKKTASIEFIATLEAVQQAGGTVIVTSRETPSAIAQLLPSLASRLAAGLVVPIALPDTAARLAILQELATARGIVLAETAGLLLAQSLCVSVPELFAALLEVSEALTIVDADRAKAYLTERWETNRPSIALIAAIVAKENQLTVKQLKSASRSRSLVTARNQAVYLARVLTGSSLDAIGEFFGKRDHTTILHSYRRIEELIQTDAITKETIAKLRKQLERS